MQEKSDAQLLCDYAERRDEVAFRELVARHTDLVYSAALRQVASPDLARDVAQSVFTDLARKAQSLAQTQKRSDSLLGWLYRGTRFAALNQLREERRRQARERQAMQQLEPASEPATDWERVQPLLDDAMSSLSDDDREALLLRFFQNRDFRAVGASLGISDDTAQKRVSRALEKLRAELVRRGVTTTAAALSPVLAAGAVQAAPAGLAATLSAAALAGTAVTTTTATAAVAKTIAMTTLQKALIAATLIAVAGTGVYEARQASGLREHVQALQRQQAPLTELIQKLQRQRDEATNRLASLTEELARTKHDTAELLRLRAAVTQLRAAAHASAPKPAESLDPAEAVARSWVERVQFLKQSFAKWPGRKTPELQLLSEQDWLNATAQRKLDTDNECREVMSELRIEAKRKFAGLAKGALDRYAAANNQQVPSTPAQLLPFFESPLDPAILEGYKIAAPGTVHPPKPGPAESEKAAVWAMIEKGEPADKEYDWHIVIYNGGAGSWSYGPSKK